MKSLKCQDVSGIKCDYVAHGHSKKEVVDKIMDHAMREHGEVIESLSGDEFERMHHKMHDMVKDN